MMRILALLFLLSMSSAVVAQNDKPAPTVQVVGNGKASIRPDLGVLIIRITSKSMNFAQTITGLNDKTKDVSKQILSIGFKQDDIKTTDFQIEENRIYRKENFIDSGYIAQQSVKVDFDNKKEVITKILNTFSKSTTDFTLSFDFKLSEELRMKVQNDLVRLAIKDSKEKAMLIAESAGIKLKRIKEISYGTNFSNGMRKMYDSPPPLASSPDRADQSIIGFTPNDLLYEDAVLITWEIE